jgi:glycosyltransferase involved in cell wall biosynthesis
MKICILGTAYPYRGGLAAFNERLARQFQNEGHEVVVETFTLQYPNFLFPGKTQFSESPVPSDLTIQRSVNSVNPFNWIAVGRKIRDMRPDLLVLGFWIPFMAPCMGTIARIVRGNGHTKVSAILHNVVPHEPRIGDEALVSYLIKSIDGCVVMSKSVEADVLRFESDKSVGVSPHPLYDHFGTPMSREEALASLSLDASCRYLLFFGLIRDYKGLDLLLKAFADERIDKSKVRLLIAGEYYGDGTKYEQMARDLGICENVVWHTRYIADADVKTYFSVADLIVQPYKTATQSGVTQIAYHFEKPMLVTNVGGLSEIVPHGKVGYVAEADPNSIADALADFCANTPDFSQGILDEKRKYAWENMTKSVISVVM